MHSTAAPNAGMGAIGGVAGASEMSGGSGRAGVAGSGGGPPRPQAHAAQPGQTQLQIQGGVGVGGGGGGGGGGSTGLAQYGYHAQAHHPHHSQHAYPAQSQPHPHPHSHPHSHAYAQQHQAGYGAQSYYSQMNPYSSYAQHPHSQMVARPLHHQHQQQQHQKQQQLTHQQQQIHQQQQQPPQQRLPHGSQQQPAQQQTQQQQRPQMQIDLDDSAPNSPDIATPVVPILPAPAPSSILTQSIGGPGAPVIYGAVYSGIPVYEMMCNGVALMRRRSDSYFNVTQMLKVAGVEKAKRAKILERELLQAQGVYEKIQGGYGKYQGTWFPFSKSIAFAQKYGCYELIKPLVDFQPPAGGPPPRINNYNTNQFTSNNNFTANRPLEPRPPRQTPAHSGLPYQPHTQQVQLQQPNHQNSAPIPLGPSSSLSASENSAIAAARQNLDGGPSLSAPSVAVAMRITTGASAISTITKAPTVPAGNSEVSDVMNANTAARPKRVARTADLNDNHSESSFDEDDPPPSPPMPANSGSGRIQRSVKRQRVAEDSDSVDSNEESLVVTASRPVKKLSTVERQRALILSIFTNPDRQDVPDFLLVENTKEQGFEPDLTIDDAGHTALHWAATLAKIPLVSALISSKACSPTAVNAQGESALTRAVLSTNNHEAQSFRSLLSHLGLPVIRTEDSKTRTILHHLALGCGVRGHGTSSRYYMECVLELITAHRNRADNIVDLNALLDARDCNGDTALNIAARLGGRMAVEMLLEAGANAHLGNLAGLKPSDFGMDDLWKSRGLVSDPVTIPAAASGAGRGDSEELDASELIIQRANGVANDVQKILGILNETFNTQVKAQQYQVSIKQRHLESLATEMAELNRMNVLLRSQNSRLPDLKAKMRSIEESLTELLDKDAASSREAMERDLENVKTNGSASEKEGEDPDDLSGFFEETSAADAEAEVAGEQEAVLQRLAVLNSHLGKELDEIKTVEEEISAGRAEDAQHEMKYRRLISTCCALRLEDVTDDLILLMRTAAESEDNGTSAGFGSETTLVAGTSGVGAIMLGVSGTAAAAADGGGTVNGISLSAEALTPSGSRTVVGASGITGSSGEKTQQEQQDMMMDGLLYKAASLSAPE
ncbi:hypothetical protein BC830DRAFT_1257142 [Chytriomyces sp. MP71]|nr:hypothetical protein BC830DRAFT_1257142 [Chytriomyces sp. MP71]